MNRRVAILGASGTIGKLLTNALSDRYHVTAITRAQIDLTNKKAVYNYFLSNYFDTVIHAAINSDTNMTSFNQQALRDNLLMFTNLVSCKHLIGKVINIGSGAEFDRRYDILELEEECIFDRMPLDHYGLSKNFCSRWVHTLDDFYTLRLFGVFHHTEPETRLLQRIRKNEKLVIEDRYFDYISAEDLVSVVNYYIEKTYLLKDINVVYSTKLKLSQFIRQFCGINNLPMDNITFTTSNLHYVGSGGKLQQLNIPLVGIEEGFKQYI